ncbi:hypothetical protein CC2G_008319 [Coprinopsis cinerea AmutBmut pab1-1]|nr:hypothetical protein CC2G_008319 [Coprinopsis cinerea AmutBmut pab1-1]
MFESILLAYYTSLRLLSHLTFSLLSSLVQILSVLEAVKREWDDSPSIWRRTPWDGVAERRVREGMCMKFGHGHRTCSRDSGHGTCLDRENSRGCSCVCENSSVRDGFVRVEYHPQSQSTTTCRRRCGTFWRDVQLSDDGSLDLDKVVELLGLDPRYYAIVQPSPNRPPLMHRGRLSRLALHALTTPDLDADLDGSPLTTPPPSPPPLLDKAFLKNDSDQWQRYPAFSKFHTDSPPRKPSSYPRCSSWSLVHEPTPCRLPTPATPPFMQNLTPLSRIEPLSFSPSLADPHSFSLCLFDASSLPLRLTEHPSLALKPTEPRSLPLRATDRDRSSLPLRLTELHSLPTLTRLKRHLRARYFVWRCFGRMVWDLVGRDVVWECVGRDGVWECVGGSMKGDDGERGGYGRRLGEHGHWCEGEEGCEDEGVVYLPCDEDGCGDGDGWIVPIDAWMGRYYEEVKGLWGPVRDIDPDPTRTGTPEAATLPSASTEYQSNCWDQPTSTSAPTPTSALLSTPLEVTDVKGEPMDESEEAELLLLPRRSRHPGRIGASAKLSEDMTKTTKLREDSDIMDSERGGERYGSRGRSIPPTFWDYEPARRLYCYLGYRTTRMVHMGVGGA